MGVDLRQQFLDLNHQLSGKLEELGSNRGSTQIELQDAFEAISLFEKNASKIYQIRKSIHPSDPFRYRAEDNTSNISLKFLSLARKDVKSSDTRTWTWQYRQIWKFHLHLFWMTTCIFVGATLLGWIIALQYTEYVTPIIGQEMMETIIQNKAWFERLNDNPLIGGTAIAINNIKVCITVFFLSALFGLGGIGILIFNGLMIGAIMGFCYINGFHESLTNFILAHGPLELSIIAASAFAGMVYGQVFFMRPLKEFVPRMKIAGREAGVIIIGILPWLILAGIVEGFVSPNPGIPPIAKISLGLFIATLFWAWTFWPQRHQRNVANRIKS